MSDDVRDIPLVDKYFQHLGEVRKECTYLGFRLLAPPLFFVDEIRRGAGIIVCSTCELAAWKAAQNQNWEELSALKRCTVTSKVLGMTHDECLQTLAELVPIVAHRFESESAFLAPMMMFYAWAKRERLVEENNFKTACKEFVHREAAKKRSLIQ